MCPLNCTDYIYLSFCIYYTIKHQAKKTFFNNHFTFSRLDMFFFFFCLSFKINVIELCLRIILNSAIVTLNLPLLIYIKLLLKHLLVYNLVHKNIYLSQTLLSNIIYTSCDYFIKLHFISLKTDIKIFYRNIWPFFLLKEIWMNSYFSHRIKNNFPRI